MVFGYGYETWEWTIDTPIRSALHPFIYAICYWILKVTGFDTGFLVAYSPRLIQAVFLVITDIYVFKIANYLFKERKIAQICVLCHLMSWSLNYAMVRTLSNSIETTIMLIAFYYWIQQTNTKFSIYDILVGALYAYAFLLRPTSAIISITLIIIQIVRYKFTAIKNLILAAILGALPVVLFGILVDSLYYGKFQFTMYYFAKINIAEGISKYYGSHEPFWYFTTGLPFYLLTYVPFAVFGLIKCWKEIKDRALIYLILVYIGAMSLLAHKEDRFMLPVIVHLVIISGFCLSGILQKYKKTGLFLILFCVFSQLIFLGIYNNVYRSGSLPLMDELRNTPKHDLTGIYFLGPCHSTPYYSHIHRYLFY